MLIRHSSYRAAVRDHDPCAHNIFFRFFLLSFVCYAPTVWCTYVCFHILSSSWIHVSKISFKKGRNPVHWVQISSTPLHFLFLPYILVYLFTRRFLSSLSFSSRRSFSICSYSLDSSCVLIWMVELLHCPAICRRDTHKCTQ